jgi:hypothetical protein
MNNATITYGSNLWDFYLIPTIKIERHCEMVYLTIEWLKWYFGISWEVEAEN